jgi:PPOX class probable F420-dependent enzyme
MAEAVLPDPSTPFGERVRRRLSDEVVIWMTTVARDGTPQPNPVWFWWDGASFLVYNRPDARRLEHVRARPNVALNFDGNGRGGDIVIVTGRAELAPSEPPPHLVLDYVAKYGDMMTRVSGGLEEFSRQYSVPLRVRPVKVRGF